MMTSGSKDAVRWQDGRKGEPEPEPANPAYPYRDREDQAAVLRTQLQRFETAFDSVSQGICLFGADERLVLYNRRYAEIYGLPPDALKPGLSLEEIVAQRLAAGAAPVADTDYLTEARAINADGAPRTWNISLSNGRTIQICHQPTPDGGWVATHEDITELAATRELLDERVSLQALIDQVPDYLWVKDRKSRFVIVNKALAVDSGRDSAADMRGLNDFDIHEPSRASAFAEAEQHILRTGVPLIDEEEFIVDAQGTGKWLSSTKVPMRNGRNEVVGLIGIARDITARKRADSFRSGQAQILEMIATSAPLGEVLTALMHLMEAQLEGVFCSVQLIDSDGLLRLGAAPSLDPSYLEQIDGAAVGPKAGSCGTAAFRRERVIVTDIREDPLWDDWRHLVEPFGYRSCWSMPILSPEGTVLGVFAMYSSAAREPTEEELALIQLATRFAGIAIERTAAEEQIRFLANHDPLTGLPNRALLEDRLSQALLFAERDRRPVTVLFIDLDNFKLVNDTLGHNAGDTLLKLVAARMVEAVRATDTVVRIGGDEFVIILSEQRAERSLVAETVQRIQAAIARPIQLGAHQLRPTASIGIATYPRDGRTADALLANADTAMYRAKELSSGSFQFYTPALNSKAQQTLRLQAELQDALARSEFQLLYQPQVSFPARKIFAVEALIRWDHPQQGNISPATFIPVAEDTGLIVSIGDWVLNEACRQNRAWQDAGLRPITVCVNVSARQFSEGRFVERVRCALARSGLAARYLELEITESSIMRDVDAAVDSMKELQELGVGVSIDDFGTGYSSLSALKTFPVGRLKVDKSFVEHVADHAEDQAVAGAIIALGQNLKLSVIAEGVETEAQAAVLAEHGCREMQGYYFGRPAQSEEITRLLREE
jgi:diguanylate cyclase (GGDEF)-like protein/PAS domain S-box-containing protein